MQAIVLAFKEEPSFVRLRENLKDDNYPIHIWGMDRHVEPLLIKALEKKGKLRLVVTYDEKRARQIVSDYKLYERGVLLSCEGCSFLLCRYSQ